MSTITTGKVVIYKPNFSVNQVDTLVDLPILGVEDTFYVIKGASSSFALQLYSDTHNITSYQDLVNDIQDYASRFIKIRVN